MWIIRIYGGNATSLYIERWATEPEDRDLEALLEKYDATNISISPRNG